MKKPDPALVPDFSATLPMKLLQARECFTQYFRPMLRAHDLTEQQWRVLRALADHGSLEISVLAAHCFILMPSLSRILQHLEARGLVTREAVQSDQRRTAIQLTDEGRSLFEATIGEVEHCYREILERFDARQMQALDKMLDDLIAATDGR